MKLTERLYKEIKNNNKRSESKKYKY